MGCTGAQPLSFCKPDLHSAHVPPRLLLASLCWLAFSFAAEAQASPGDLAAVMGLSTADGSVRTQTSVRMALSPLPGTDSVLAMQAPLQARMPEIRACFVKAMSARAGVEGRVVVRVERKDHRHAKAKVTHNETGDPQLGACMERALARTDLRAVKGLRSGVLVAIDLRNPNAKLRESVKAHRPKVDVKQIGQGRVRSVGGTQNGEVTFSLEASAYAREALIDLHNDMQARLAGLLDCRRKASRRGQPAEGTVSSTVTVNAEGVARSSRPKSTAPRGRQMSECVSNWIKRANRDRLKGVEADLVVAFSP